MSEYYKKYIKYKNKYINLQTQMGGVLPATSEAELLRPRRMGNLQNAIPYVPPPMLQVTPNSNQAEKDAIIAEGRRKREAIMNKLLGNTTELERQYQQTQSGTSEAELLRPMRMGNPQNTTPYVPSPMLQVTPNSNQAEMDAIIAAVHKKREAIMNKLLGNMTELGDEPPPVVRQGNPSYSYDRDAIDEARELAEAKARIANRNNEDKLGLFKQAVKDKDDEKKRAQNMPYRESNNRWPYAEIIEQRKKDYAIVKRNRPTIPEVLTPVRAANPNYASYDDRVKMEADALVEALVRIENRANEDTRALEEERIRSEKIAMNQLVRGGESRRSWPWPEVIKQREEDNKLIEDNKEFLEKNRTFLESYNLYPTIILDTSTDDSPLIPKRQYRIGSYEYKKF
jgi:hypothetical protein